MPRNQIAIAVLCAAAALSFTAGAQQTNPAPAPGQMTDPAPQTLPDSSNNPAGQNPRRTREQSPRDNPHIGRGESGRNFDRQGARFNETDRQAFFEARLAAVKAGLMLNEAQLALWPAVESAVREMARHRQESAQQSTGASAGDFFDQMRKRGEALSARGKVITAMAGAMAPFHDSLDPDQKRRLRTLMRPMQELSGWTDSSDRQGAASQQRYHDSGDWPDMRQEYQQRGSNQRGYRQQNDDRSDQMQGRQRRGQQTGPERER